MVETPSPASSYGSTVSGVNPSAQHWLVASRSASQQQPSPPSYPLFEIDWRSSDTSGRQGDLASNREQGRRQEQHAQQWQQQEQEFQQWQQEKYRYAPGRQQ
eukprot:scaffold557_cov19-Tisochrysis_lutea.AAC.6